MAERWCKLNGVADPTVTGVSVGEGLGGGVGYLIAPATLVFYLLNLYWMYKILRGVIDKVCLKRD
jgi:ABC-type Fe3+-siderophore transport system permease subunit